MTFRRVSGDLVLAIVLGLLVIAGWSLGAGNDRANPASLTFVDPTGQSLAFLMLGGAASPRVGVALVAGTVIGAAIWTAVRSRFRFEYFTDGADMVRNLAGGTLMGVGGTLALGCTIGQGVSGISTLSIGSFVALGAILLGAWWALKFLESGRLFPVQR